MRDIRAIVKRVRSRTPVTVLTPLGVVWVSGFIVSTSSDLSDTHAGYATFLGVLAIVVVACAWLLSFIDRLFRMRSADASWSMFASLTLFALMTGAGPISILFDNPHRDYPTAAACIVISPMLALLAVREFTWLRGGRRAGRFETVA